MPDTKLLTAVKGEFELCIDALTNAQEPEEIALALKKVSDIIKQGSSTLAGVKGVGVAAGVQSSLITTAIAAGGGNMAHTTKETFLRKLREFTLQIDEILSESI